MPDYNPYEDWLEGFFSEQGVEHDYQQYFDVYNPTQESNIRDRFQQDVSKVQPEYKKQKRQLMSQAAKMGFAGSGAYESASKDLYSLFSQKQGLLSADIQSDLYNVRQGYESRMWDMLGRVVSLQEA